jgi:hypothetical protein
MLFKQAAEGVCPREQVCRLQEIARNPRRLSVWGLPPSLVQPLAGLLRRAVALSKPRQAGDGLL